MANKKLKVGNVPNLRFPEFIDDWKMKKLGEVAEFKVTNSFSRDNLNYENGTVKNIHYGDIHTKFHTLFDITKETVPYINKEIAINKISADFYCKEGDIIFADASEDLNDVGKSIEILNLNDEKILSGLHTLLARPTADCFHKGFNGYLFKSNSVRLQIQKEAQGSKVLSINVGRISNVKLCFPTLVEQQKIASFLSLIDDRIQTQNKIIEELKILKATLSHKIFSQQLRFKYDNGSDFSDWEVNKLGRIGTFFSGGTPLTSKKHYFNGNIPFIRSGEINADTTEQYISKEGLKNSSAKMIEVGDLIYALYGATSGEVGISKITGAINQAILCIRTDMNNVFLLNYLRIQKESIIKTYLQGGQGNLSAEIIKSLEIPIPCIEEQIKIATFLSLKDEKIEAERKILQHLKNQKKYLLSNLFI